MLKIGIVATVMLALGVAAAIWAMDPGQSEAQSFSSPNIDVDDQETTRTSITLDVENPNSVSALGDCQSRRTGFSGLWSEKSPEPTISAGGTVSIVFTGLTENQSYDFRCRLKTTTFPIQQSQYSGTVSATPRPGPCNGAMSGATSVAVGSTATVNWAHGSGQGRPDTYAWNASNGISISGSSTGSSVTIRGDTAGNGSLSVTVTCTNTSQDTQTRSITVTSTACAGSVAANPATITAGSTSTARLTMATESTLRSVTWARSSNLSQNAILQGVITVKGESAGAGTVTANYT